MTKIVAIRCLCVSALLAGLTILGGCSNFDIDTRLSEDLASKTVTVHVVGVNASEIQQWKTYSVTEYFRPGNPLRESAVADGYAHVMNFGAGKPNPQKLERGSQMWRTWNKRHAEYLIVLACLPGYGDKDDKVGSSDPRRLILPARGSQWDRAYWGMNRIELEVSRGKVACLTRYKPVQE